MFILLIPTMADKTTVIETKETIPELLQKPRKRDKEAVKKNLIDTLSKVNVFKKVQELRKENQRLIQDNKRLRNEIEMVIQTIDPQRKVFIVHK